MTVQQFIDLLNNKEVPSDVGSITLLAYSGVAFVALCAVFWLMSFVLKKLFPDRVGLSGVAPPPPSYETTVALLVSGLACVLLFVGSELVAAFIVHSIGAEFSPSGRLHIAITIAALIKIAGVILVLRSLVRLTHDGDQHYNPVQALSKMWTWPLIYMIWIPMVIAASLFGQFFLFGVDPTFGIDDQDVLKRVMLGSQFQVVALIFGPIVAAPLIEELFFRGIMQRGIERMASSSGSSWIHQSRFAIAAIPTAFLFTLAHDPMKTPHLIPSLVVLSLVLSLIYHRSKNIWHSIALHAIHNSIAVVLSLLTQTA